MNAKKAMPLILAVVLGLVAMIMAKKLLKPAAPVHVQSDTTPVVIATRDVPPGKELTPDDLATAPIPTSAVPTGAATTVAQLQGRVAITPMVKGQAVLETLLAPTGAGVGLTALIPEGMRAMTMNIDEVTGLGGMIIPGCHVDINVMVPDEKSKQQTAYTVLQDLKIVAVGRNFTAPSGDAAPAAPTNNITFLVTPDQGRMLELAASTARPWLVLRNGRDTAALKANRTLISELHGLTRDEAWAGNLTPTTGPTTGPSDSALAALTNRRNWQPVEVIRGPNVTRITLPMPAELGGSGLATRGDDNGASTAKTNKPVKAGGRGLDSTQSARPTATSSTEDPGDAFLRDPFPKDPSK